MRPLRRPPLFLCGLENWPLNEMILWCLWIANLVVLSSFEEGTCPILVLVELDQVVWWMIWTVTFELFVFAAFSHRILVLEFLQNNLIMLLWDFGVRMRSCMFNPRNKLNIICICYGECFFLEYRLVLVCEESVAILPLPLLCLDVWKKSNLECYFWFFSKSWTLLLPFLILLEKVLTSLV